MTTEQLNFDAARKVLTEGSLANMKQSVESNPSLRGDFHPNYGAIKLGQYVCAYTDVVWANQLEICFGLDGSVKGAEPDLTLNADIISNLWIDSLDQRQRYTNQELTQHCLKRLYDISRHNQTVHSY